MKNDRTRKNPGPPAGGPQRVLGYVRVSGAEQGRHGTSLAGQGEAITRYCKERGLPPPETRVEIESASAQKIERRVELKGLLAEAKPGDLIIVWKLDRWSRDLVYAVQSVRALVARGVAWYSISEALDPATPQGDSALGIMSYMADEERKRIRERTVGRRFDLRDQGYYADGLAPFGLRRGARSERAQLTLVAVEKEAALVVEAYQRCAAGASVSQVMTWLIEASGRRWDKGAVGKLLRGRVYLGEVRNTKGEWIPGKVPVIVSRELFDRAGAALDSRRYTGGPHPSAVARTASWLLRGLGSCPECGARMGASYSGGPTGGRYLCGRRSRAQGCTAPTVLVAEADAEADVMVLARLQELREELAASVPAKGTKTRDVAAELARVATRRRRAVDLAVEGTITKAELQAQLARLDGETTKLEAVAAEAARASSAQEPKARGDALATVEGMARAWAGMSIEARREAIRLLSTRILIRPDRLEIGWKSAEALAAEKIK